MNPFPPAGRAGSLAIALSAIGLCSMRSAHGRKLGFLCALGDMMIVFFAGLFSPYFAAMGALAVPAFFMAILGLTDPDLAEDRSVRIWTGSAALLAPAVFASVVLWGPEHN